MKELLITVFGKEQKPFNKHTKQFLIERGFTQEIPHYFKDCTGLSNKEGTVKIFPRDNHLFDLEIVGKINCPSISFERVLNALSTRKLLKR